jgi:hypothetical protein
VFYTLRNHAIAPRDQDIVEILVFVGMGFKATRGFGQNEQIDLIGKFLWRDIFEKHYITTVCFSLGDEQNKFIVRNNCAVNKSVTKLLNEITEAEVKETEEMAAKEKESDHK